MSTSSIVGAMQRAHTRLNTTLDGFVKGGADFEKAKMLIPFFYYFLFFIAFTYLEGLNYTIAKGVPNFSPRFPLFWASHVDYGVVVTTVFLIWLLSALLASFFPYARSARILAFVGFFEFHAFMSSFGNPYHQWDHWLWISFILIFLPTLTRESSSDTRRTFSLVFWGAQAFLLLTYSMAGIGKLIYAFIQFSQGQAHAFSPDAGALYAATQLNLMHETVPLANLIISHPWLAWLPFLLILELQTFALVAAFRPQLHRIWGLGLILFHIGTFLTMRAIFTAPSGLLLLFLLASPFAPERQKWSDIVFSLPIFGRMFKYIADEVFARVSKSSRQDRG